MTFHSRAFLLSLCILLTSGSILSAVPVHQWSKGFGDIGSDVGLGVAVDASDNVIMAGWFQNTVNFGGGDLVSAGSFDMFIAKYNASGTHQWSKGFGSTTTDVLWAVAVDALGNVIVVGEFGGTLNVGGGDLVSAGSDDIFLAKFNASGVHQWSQSFGASALDQGLGVAVDASGSVIVTGWFQGTVDFGGGNFISAGDRDVFVARFDASGGHRWSHSFGSTGLDGGLAVAVDASDNVIVVGRFEGTVDIGGGNLVSAGDRDVFVAKYDTSGVHQWSQRFGGTLQDEAWGVTVDVAGNVLVTGQFAGTVDFGGGNLASAGQSDIFVAKYNATGAHQWSQRFGGTGLDGGMAVAVDASDNVLATGWFSNAVNFGGGFLVSAGSFDNFVAKFDAAGVHQWSERSGGTGQDAVQAVAADGLGNVVVTGGFEDTVDFGGGNLTSAGFSDAFLAKYSDSQTPVFINAFDATSRGGAVELTWGFWSDEALDHFALYRRHGESPSVMIASGDAETTRSHTDASVEPGETYSYELVIRTAGGSEFRSPVATVTAARLVASLSQNFPNPFNPQTTIEYTVDTKALVSIDVFDASGALVTRLDQGEREAGAHRVEWDGRDATGRRVSSGVYFYRLAGVRGGETRKMVLLK